MDRAKEQDGKAAKDEAERAKAEKTIATLKRQEESVRERMLVLYVLLGKRLSAGIFLEQTNGLGQARF